MADTLIKRPIWYPYERVDDTDVNRGSGDALSNLALFAQFGFAPELGVLRGLVVGPTDPVSMLATCSPGAAAIANTAAPGTAGLAIVESDRNVGPFATNNSGQDRIDLVSLRYAEARGQTEQRNFVQADNSKFQAAVNTRIIANPQLVVTQGVPGTPPAAPATPVGDIALAQVLIRNGAASIIASDITRDPILDRVLEVIIEPGNQAISWVSDPILTRRTPAGMATLLLCKFQIAAAGGNLDKPIAGILLDGNENIVISQVVFRTPPNEGVNVASPMMMAVRRGPHDGAYRLRVSGADITAANIFHVQLVAVTL